MTNTYPGSYSVNTPLPAVSIRPASPEEAAAARRTLLLSGQIPLSAQTQAEADLMFVLAVARGRARSLTRGGAAVIAAGS